MQSTSLSVLRSNPSIQQKTTFSDNDDNQQTDVYKLWIFGYRYVSAVDNLPNFIEKTEKWGEQEKVRTKKSPIPRLSERCVDEVVKYIVELAANTNEIDILKLKSYPLMTLPDNLCDLKHLTSLTVSDAKLEPFTQTFKLPPLLESLDLSGNALTSVSKLCFNLPRLNELRLGANRLSSLPDSFAMLTNLEILSLVLNSDFATIPEVVLSLKKLKSLYVGRDGTFQIPEKISQLKSLRLLSVTGRDNCAPEFPRALLSLSGLTSLSLSDTHVEAIPPMINALSKLETLSLIRVFLSLIPEEIGELNKLKELTLVNNQLKELPHGITKLKELSLLRISSNLFKVTIFDKNLLAILNQLPATCNIDVCEIKNAGTGTKLRQVEENIRIRQERKSLQNKVL